MHPAPRSRGHACALYGLARALLPCPRHHRGARRRQRPGLDPGGPGEGEAQSMAPPRVHRTSGRGTARGLVLWQIVPGRRRMSRAVRRAHRRRSRRGEALCLDPRAVGARPGGAGACGRAESPDALPHDPGSGRRRGGNRRVLPSRWAPRLALAGAPSGLARSLGASGVRLDPARAAACGGPAGGPRRRRDPDPRVLGLPMRGRARPLRLRSAARSGRREGVAGGSVPESHGHGRDVGARARCGHAVRGHAPRTGRAPWGRARTRPSKA